MTEEEKKKLIEQLDKAKETGFKSQLDDLPEAKCELLIGQLRYIKAHLEYAKRKGMEGEELDDYLDKYIDKRAKILKEIEDAGCEYEEGEEDAEKYDKYEM